LIIDLFKDSLRIELKKIISQDQTYATKNTHGLGLMFQFFKYLSYEFEFEYFANLLQIKKIII
jgi:hypothetical protein